MISPLTVTFGLSSKSIWTSNSRNKHRVNIACANVREKGELLLDIIAPIGGLLLSKAIDSRKISYNGCSLHR